MFQHRRPMLPSPLRHWCRHRLPLALALASATSVAQAPVVQQQRLPELGRSVAGSDDSTALVLNALILPLLSLALGETWGFAASGEPASLPSQHSLEQRNGPLAVAPEPDGPLHVRGNLEIITGTGRTVACVQTARLCRCGAEWDSGRRCSRSSAFTGQPD